jgi:TonB family protein
MPHALLLSPDDQAVSAISAVLEEMSVSCERPLDGPSAARQLNSRSFDLVLVDCENLPAAKLIFDVCRRGKSDFNPVPIAIVDGRAGLPTAFRLGAELILTKPVAKDQARSTIRTAVGRLRKEEPARSAQVPEGPSLAAAALAPPAQRALAAAAASSETMPTSNDTPTAVVDLAPTSEMSIAADKVALAPAVPSPEAVSPATLPEPNEVVEVSQPMFPVERPDDPVVADLERFDAGSPPTSSSNKGASPKGRTGMVAVVIVALVIGASYAGWKYQPAFRAVVQPFVNRVFAFAGLASQQKTAPAPPASARIPKVMSVKPTVSTATETPSLTDAQEAKDTSAAADAPARIPTTVTVAATPAATPLTTKFESTAASEKTESPITSSRPLPNDEGLVILSSKGAEKRLIREVPPTYPQRATSPGLEGTVILKTRVDDTGRVESVHLVEGNPALADVAIHAVEQWRYRPYVRDGKSLPFQTIVLVDFQRP